MVPIPGRPMTPRPAEHASWHVFDAGVQLACLTWLPWLAWAASLPCSEPAAAEPPSGQQQRPVEEGEFEFVP
jgi:hypothetical protein